MERRRTALYLIIGIRYWFRTPIVGIAISCVSFVASWAVLQFLAA